ncbi:DUF6708 domain-containing protein [Pseudomonas aeruginosa]|uniref:DUF6708 domain-containing protein n=1 Tax=Pseudomonas aeruginosa TaxID=287 RepID=UPI0021F0C25E|nr:DUF6708 domain-containing protein [Pseudomonas aeruginosa]MCO1771035.1 hypothetical protein [Pseudomonas aeruginosa]MCV4112922.1 hypothetical protein [Pseudomonas aeruginosa]MCV4246088.1 hypothetical protein [Pseudomonas aeruginosa]MCV4249919.1 hypothetical protein [Pseudomonas aeruginosa]
MSEHPEAGTTRSGPLWQDDCLAPPAIPTGEKPADVLNVIWRKNEVFLDIGSWALGSAVMILWAGFITAVLVIWLGWDVAAKELLIGYGIILGIPILILLIGLRKPVPPPIRFNRQRREVCVPQKDGSHWFVPWESVKAVGTAVSSVGQHGRATQGLLVIGFPNPQWNGKSEEDKEYSLALSCGGGTTAMAMWECIRSYMEVGPDAVPTCHFEGEQQHRSLLGWYWLVLSDAGKAMAKGDMGAALKDLFFTVCLGAPLGLYLQERKLIPPPDLNAPDVVEWSKPLPPDQWTHRSAELERAIQAREADLRERSSQ